MKLSELQTLLGDEVVFRASTLMAGQKSPADVRRQVSRWVTTGKVVALRRGVYMLAGIPAGRRPHPFALANEMRRASYVSLQSALAHYGMIPEFAPTVISVTTERPETLATPVGRFMFRHIKRDLFWGVEAVEVAPGQMVRLATREKALIDLLYLTPGSDRKGYLEELRLDPDDRLSTARLLEMAGRTKSHKVLRAIRSLVRVWKQGEEGKYL